MVFLGTGVKRRFRLTKSKDIQRVRQLGKSYAHPLLVLIVLTNTGETIRIGIITGKAVGKAVQRNLAKRRVRAAVQNYIQMIEPGWDVLFIGRKEIADATYPEIEVSVRDLLKRSKILHDHNGTQQAPENESR